MLLRNSGGRIALCPPLIISEQEVDLMVGALGQALDDTLETFRASADMALPA